MLSLLNTRNNVFKTSRVSYIPVDQIVPNPGQPRKVFDEETLGELADSIAMHGILQPLLVRQNERGEYELISGERRLRAARLAGLSEVPCILSGIEREQSAVYALIENLQRQDLHFFEEAEGIGKLIVTYGLTQEETALRLSKKQSTIANKLRLLKLGPAVRRRILEAGLTERHARALLKLPEESRQLAALDQIISRGLNVAKSEQLIEDMLAAPKTKPKRIMVVKDLRLFINTINHAVMVMRNAGISAVSTKRETPNYIEYVIQIPKSS